MSARSVYDSESIHEPHGQKTPFKAALASWIGSALEYYDFFIYGTAAALVFGRIFFPSSDPAAGTLLALATFGVGYVARPVGAFFMGHIGDKFGRKRVLIFTLILMGASTFLVGCLPTYNQVGVFAPLLLVILRLCQGFSASGEQAGANSMTLEHAPANRRAFVTSFTLSGTQAGQILATAVFLPITRLPEDQLLAWGWRVPFWLASLYPGGRLEMITTSSATGRWNRDCRKTKSRRWCRHAMVICGWAPTTAWRGSTVCASRFLTATTRPNYTAAA